MLLEKPIEQAINTLKSGGILLHPTDTVWGIACDPFNREAVEKVRKIKNKPEKHPFILLTHSLEIIKKYVENIHPRIETLLSLHQRPLTIIYPGSESLEPPLVNDDGGVAIRLVKSGVCSEILEAFGQPLLSTSANLHGDKTPGHFGEISSDIIKSCDYVFPFSRDEKNNGLQKPSPIATYNPKNGDLEFIRE